jgi:fructokinase
MVDALVIGESLIDIVETSDSVREYPGGSPANVALTMGRLGRDVVFETAFGDDARGERIADWLTGSGVDVLATRSMRTSTAKARIGSDGSADYVFDVAWSLNEDSAPAASVVHTGSIAATLQPGAAQVTERLRQRRTESSISFDPNIRPSLIEDAAVAREQVSTLAGFSDIIKLSDEDLEWLHPQQDARRVAGAWLDHGVAIVVVTLGRAGSLTFTRSGELRTPAEKVNVADTVGAGDTFTGAFLSSLLAADLLGAAHRERLREISIDELEASLRFASSAAAITVSRPGANPPWVAELASA